MQARTAFRLAMLRNGFWPLLNDCKRSIEPGWPIKIPDETEVLSWAVARLKVVTPSRRSRLGI